jgi:hypothetical protein
MRRLLPALLALTMACDPGEPEPVAATAMADSASDAGADSGSAPADPGATDVGTPDVAGSDTSPIDVAPPDAPTEDAAGVDAMPGDVATPDVAAQDATGPDTVTGPFEEALAIRAKHDALFEAVRGTLAAPGLCDGGAWHEHYGDAPMYGPSFDAGYWSLTGDEQALERALLTLELNLETVEEAVANPLVLTTKMESVAMSLLGLVEASRFIDDDRYHVAADALLELVDALAADLDDYLLIDAGAFAPSTYGPTSISSFVALVHTEHVLAWPDHDAAHHTARAREVLENIHARAWDAALGAYRFAPDDDRLTLYPNITMMLAWGRLLQLTGEADVAERMRAIRKGIEPLRDEDGDHFHSPYSAAYMGALDDDYSTLSSQNYLMMGLWLGFRGTGEEDWLLDLDTLLGFLSERLLVDGRLLHHWMNGKVAQPGDKEFYCSGCNLQTLYVMTLLEQPD